jgi:GST-like protein
MLELYTFGTSNGQRASIMLEECGLPYRAHKVDLAAGAQRQPAFLALNPAGQIPTLVDPDGPGGRLVVSQSAAIILYLAEKSGKLLPAAGAERWTVLTWFMAVMTDVAPASASLFYAANRADPPAPSAVALFQRRLLDAAALLDRRLAESEFLAGPFSIADVALYPTLATRKALIDEQQGLSNLKGWIDEVGRRPGVAKGMAVPG